MKNLATLFLLFTVWQAPLVWSAPVNVNIAAAEDIASALDGVNLKLAEQIVMQCELEICTGPQDLQHLEGMTPELMNKIQVDLMFNVLERGMDLNSEC